MHIDAHEPSVNTQPKTKHRHATLVFSLTSCLLLISHLSATAADMRPKHLAVYLSSSLLVRSAAAVVQADVLPGAVLPPIIVPQEPLTPERSQSAELELEFVRYNLDYWDSACASSIASSPQSPLVADLTCSYSDTPAHIPPRYTQVPCITPALGRP